MKHFLRETNFKRDDLRPLFRLAHTLKHRRGQSPSPALAGQSWGMLFFKNSTRTRISFEVGIRELGGHPVILNSQSTQLSRGESIADTAKIMSRYLHGIIIRCYDHAVIEEFARAGSIPVVNALTDFLHPCQIYSDAFTLAEYWSDGDDRLLSSLRGKKIAFLGDTACNMANSWIFGASLFGMELALAGPKKFQPDDFVETELRSSGLEKTYTFTTDPVEAVRGADIVYTDVWVSMGDEAEREKRLEMLKPYQVNANLMTAAKPTALFMHCLPAHPGEEVTQEVLDSDGSIIFDQAENRLHMQKAILASLSDANNMAREPFPG